MKGYVAHEGHPLVRRRSTKASIRSPGESGDAGTRPAPAAPMPNGSPRGSPATRNGRNDEARSLSFGAYLTRRWLPGKRVEPRHLDLRRLPPQDRAPHPPHSRPHADPPAAARAARGALRLDAPPDRRAPAARTEDRPRDPPRHPRRARDAVRQGLVTRNVALVAHAPRLRSIPKVEPESWTAQQLQAFLRAAAGHRLFAALWVSPLHRHAPQRAARPPLGRHRPRQGDAIDQPRARRRRLRAPRVTRQDRQRPPSHRPRPDDRRRAHGWRRWQATERTPSASTPTGWMFTDGDGEPVHPHAISQTFERIARRAERPGHPAARPAPHPRDAAHRRRRSGQGRQRAPRPRHAAFTIETYQHVLPGMQADAARVFEQLIAAAFYRRRPPVEDREKRRKKTA